jgi:antitoxin PrlF
MRSPIRLLLLGRATVMGPDGPAASLTAWVPGHRQAHPRQSGSPDKQILCKETGMAACTFTAKGQTTVPADIRALVDAKPGTRLDWSLMPDGTIIVRAQTQSMLDMAGISEASAQTRTRTTRSNDNNAAPGKARR